MITESATQSAVQNLVANIICRYYVVRSGSSEHVGAIDSDNAISRATYFAKVGTDYVQALVLSK